MVRSFRRLVSYANASDRVAADLLGREWGVSTGRKRRCGWLDLVVLKYSKAVNHYTALNLTKLDVLDTFPVIKVSPVATCKQHRANWLQVAVAYKDPSTGEEIGYFPADLDNLKRFEVVYKEFEGWQKPTTAARSFVCFSNVSYAHKSLTRESTTCPSKHGRTLNSSRSLLASRLRGWALGRHGMIWYISPREPAQSRYLLGFDAALQDIAVDLCLESVAHLAAC